MYGVSARGLSVTVFSESVVSDLTGSARLWCPMTTQRAADRKCNSKKLRFVTALGRGDDAVFAREAGDRYSPKLGVCAYGAGENGLLVRCRRRVLGNKEGCCGIRLRFDETQGQVVMLRRRSFWSLENAPWMCAAEHLLWISLTGYDGWSQRLGQSRSLEEGTLNPNYM